MKNKKNNPPPRKGSETGVEKMMQSKKIKEYFANITNPRTLQFVHFVDILYEWIEELFDSRRLRSHQEDQLTKFYPIVTLRKIDQCSLDTISDEEYADIKATLLKESRKLIEKVIHLGTLRPGDFDNFQFNLNQVFIKEEVTAMVEWARLHLQATIRKRKEDAQFAKETAKKEQEDYIKHLNALSPRKRTSVLINSMFDFSQKARSPEERQKAIVSNRTRIHAQRSKFRAFEDRLVDATEDARKSAQLNIHKQVGAVTQEMEVVSEKFRKKAKEFVSEEGPRKKIGLAQDMISGKKQVLEQQLKTVGKDWEKEYQEKTDKARTSIEKFMDRLKGHETRLKDTISKSSSQQSQRAKKILQQATQEFQQDVDLVTKKFSLKSKEILIAGQKEMTQAVDLVQKGKEEFEADAEHARLGFQGKSEEILEKGQSELQHARTRVEVERDQFFADVAHAQFTFEGKGKEILQSREELVVGKDDAAQKLALAMDDAERGMTTNIERGRGKFEQDAAAARELFLQRAKEMRGAATSHISGKKDAFKSKRDRARQQFTAAIPAASSAASPNKALSSQVTKQQETMMKTSESIRSRMLETINKKKELFSLDVRFAKHKIEEHAKKFADHTAAKREEFQTTQETIVSRHRAKQKATLIRSLLKVVRGM